MTQPNRLTGPACRLVYCRTNQFMDPDCHLSLADVAEEQRLWLKLVRDELTEREKFRLSALNARRVRPQYDTTPKGAA